MKRYVMRGQVYIDLSDRTSLLLTAARAKIYDSRGIDPEIFYSDTALFIDSTFGPLFGTDACPDNNPNNRVICSSAPYRVSNENNILSATLTSEIGANTMTSISAWSNYNERLNERSEEQTSELQSITSISYDIFCLKQKQQKEQK